MFFVLTKEKFYGEIVWKMDNDRQKGGYGDMKEFTIGKNDAGGLEPVCRGRTQVETPVNAA